MAMVITCQQPCRTATPTVSPCQFHTFIFQTYNGNGYYLPTAMPYGYPFSFPMSISHLYFCFTPLFFRPTMAMVITYRQPCHTATPTVSPCQTQVLHQCLQIPTRRISSTCRQPPPCHQVRPLEWYYPFTFSCNKLSVISILLT